ncbi:MAG TPA: hypothetical protein HPP76_08100 [Desulfuromonadales bacterium]|nr:hypothetical protein [Desulfuromonadales bacterium]
MRQMTLRDIPDDIEIIARDEASRQGISLNKAFLALLRKSAQNGVPQTLAADMKRCSRFSRFLGVWSDAETTAFNKVLLEQRTVDEESWR